MEGELLSPEVGESGETMPATSGTSFQFRDRVKELRRVKAADLITNPKNWRRHPKAQAAALRGLLREVGYADALLARELNDGQLMLIDGHLRAETTPTMEVPVLVLDVSEEEADKLLLSLDPLAAMAKQDPDRVKALIESVRTDDAAVEDLFRRIAGEDLWRELHPDEVAEVEVAPDRCAALIEKWHTELGQVWEIGPHRVVCGDCRSQVVEQLFETENQFRMISTDPPYGVNYGEKTEWLNRNGGGASRRPIANDSLKPAELQQLFSQALASARRFATTGASIYATVPSVFLKYFIEGMEDGGFAYHHCLIWLKQNLVMGRADYHYRHEPILYGWLADGPHYFVDDRKQDSVFEVNRPQVSELHPTTKPVELIARMIANSSKPGEIIYDPFGGSGTTVVAAHQLGRIGYSCELDPAYVAVHLERLSILGLNPKMRGRL